MSEMSRCRKAVRQTLPGNVFSSLSDKFRAVNNVIFCKTVRSMRFSPQPLKLNQQASTTTHLCCSNHHPFTLAVSLTVQVITILQCILIFIVYYVFYIQYTSSFIRKSCYQLFIFILFVWHKKFAGVAFLATIRDGWNPNIVI